MPLVIRYLVLICAVLCVAAATGPLVAAQTSPDLPIEIVPAAGYTEPVNSVAFAPDGRTALSGSWGQTLKLWDVASGKLIRTFEGHGIGVLAFAFAPDGRMALSGNMDGSLKLYDLISGKLLRTLVNTGPLDLAFSVAFARDGRTALSGGFAGTLKLWDVAGGRLIRIFEGHTDDVRSVAFTPDGRMALSGSADKTLKLWDVASGKLVRTFEGHTGIVLSVAFAPDGRTALSGGDDKTLKLWDVASGKLIQTFEGHTEKIWSVAFAPDGRTALSGSGDKTLKLWDVARGTLIRTLQGHADSVNSVAFAPDGHTVLSGSGDRTLKLWDITGGQTIRTFDRFTSRVSSVMFAPNGRTALSGGDDKILKLWDMADGRLIRTFADHTDAVNCVAYAPDGQTALSGSGDRTLKLWDVASATLIRTFEGHKQAVNSVAPSPDGRMALSGSADKTLKLWDVASGALIRTFEGHTDEVRSVAFAPDGRVALSGSRDKTLKLWDVASGALIRTFEGHMEQVQSVAFAPDGLTALSGSWDETLKLWDVASGTLIRTFKGHAGLVESVAFAPDGRTVLSGHYENGLELWDVASGRLIRSFASRQGHVNTIGFRTDGKQLIGGGSEGAIDVWTTETGEALTTLIASDDGEWLTITPEGFFDASDKGTKLLSVVRGLQLYAVDQFYQALHRPDLVREKLAGDPQGKIHEAAGRLDFAKVLTGGAAPQVTIVSPADGSTVNSSEVELDAAIGDQGGGSGRVELRINGTTLGIVNRGLSRIETPDATGATMRLHHTVSLASGDNVIEIVAYNAQGLIASHPASIKITYAGAKAVGPRLFVLAVGINDYWDSRLRLAFASTDAKSLSEGMRKAGGTLYQSVDVTTILDADATAAHLDKVFGDLALKVRPDDVFVFFIAGHGKTVDARYYFIPQDFRYAGEDSIVRHGIGQDRWQDWFARISARRSVLLFDTCESGSLTGDRMVQRGLERVVALDRMTQAMGRTVLTAATDDTPALEGYRGHGVFTYALVESFGQAEVQADGFVHVTDLASFIDREVPELSFTVFKQRQVPQMKIVGSNFPLFARTAVLSQGDVPAPNPLAKPTHVVIVPTDVRRAATSGAPVVLRLAPGSQVLLVENTDGWGLVARDGKTLGYVEDKTLARLR